MTFYVEESALLERPSLAEFLFSRIGVLFFRSGMLDMHVIPNAYSRI